MAAPNTTLRLILTRPKPHIACRLPVGKPSKATAWPSLSGASITLWTDFNLQSLNESYGHVLDRRVHEHTLAIPSPDEALSQVEILKPDDVRRLVKWNDDVVIPTVDFARRLLGLHEGVALEHKTRPSDKAYTVNIAANGSKPVHVDHLVALDDFPASRLVIGFALPSSKFRARELADDPKLDKASKVSPLRQLAHMCKIGQTCYGYVLTDEALLVCCFSRGPHDSWKVALMPVPWSRYGENQLTTDLALWWLSMLAISAPQHRAIVQEKDMIRINAWDTVFLGDVRGWVRRHQYSNVEQSVETPTSAACQSPSPVHDIPSAASQGPELGFNEDPFLGLGGIMATPGFGSFDL